MAQYGKTDYWEQRYTRDPQPFDWYQRYSGLKEVITPNISQNSQILNVGCGNSRLSQEMVDDGYAHITNIDVSVVVIQQMVEKHKEPKFANMKYLRMDVRSMVALEKGSFDCVIDKGTFDSILCGEGSDTNAQKMLSEIYRVLSPTGVYICISYGIPEQRQNYFRASGLKWDITIQKVAKPTISTSTMSAADDKEIKSFHYIYIMKKTGQA